jgi:ribonuclease Z
MSLNRELTSAKHSATGDEPRKPGRNKAAGVRGIFRIVGAIIFTLSFHCAHAQETANTGSEDLIVTLLGTGTPALDLDRYGSSNLVQAGGLNLLFDAGRGASIRLGQLGIPLGKIDGVFLTHFHSDHVNGLADIYTTGYIQFPNLGNRALPLRLYGPRGTKRLAEGLHLTHLSDIETRMLDEGTPELATKITAEEGDEGVVFEQNGVKVTAFQVLHGEKIKPALGYRVDYKGKSVVFSGDTKYDENVISFSKGVNLLVHEAGLALEETMNNPTVRTILEHHTK